MPDQPTSVLWEKWFRCEDLGVQLPPVIKEYVTQTTPYSLCMHWSWALDDLYYIIYIYKYIYICLCVCVYVCLFWAFSFLSLFGACSPFLLFPCSTYVTVPSPLSPFPTLFKSLLWLYLSFLTIRYFDSNEHRTGVPSATSVCEIPPLHIDTTTTVHTPFSLSKACLCVFERVATVFSLSLSIYIYIYYFLSFSLVRLLATYVHEEYLSHRNA